MNLDSISRLCRYNFGSTGWIAVDEDLKVYWYQVEPHIFGDWFARKGVYKLVCTKYTGDKDWKDTLTSLATIEPLCLSCENHRYSDIKGGWYCSIELTNPNNMCAGYKMRGCEDER